jgi:hypothetical protein
MIIEPVSSKPEGRRVASTSTTTTLSGLDFASSRGRRLRFVTTVARVLPTATPDSLPASLPAGRPQPCRSGRSPAGHFERFDAATGCVSFRGHEVRHDPFLAQYRQFHAAQTANDRARRLVPGLSTTSCWMRSTSADVTSRHGYRSTTCMSTRHKRLAYRTKPPRAVFFADQGCPRTAAQEGARVHAPGPRGAVGSRAAGVAPQLVSYSRTVAAKTRCTGPGQPAAKLGGAGLSMAHLPER